MVAQLLKHGFDLIVGGTGQKCLQFNPKFGLRGGAAPSRGHRPRGASGSGFDMLKGLVG
jgi:hypothetical protein